MPSDGPVSFEAVGERAVLVKWEDGFGAIIPWSPLTLEDPTLRPFLVANAEDLRAHWERQEGGASS